MSGTASPMRVAPQPAALELPADALLRLHESRPDRYPVLLESVAGAGPRGRYDLLFALPGRRLVGGAAGGPPFLAALDRWFAREAGPAPAGAPPFTGGWFLYLGYELAAEIEPTLRLPQPRRPVAVAWRMHGAVIRDRLSGAAWVGAETDGLEALGTAVCSDLAAAGDWGAQRAGPPPAAVAVDVVEEPAERFLEGVDAVQQAIARGDVYQANLSRGWQARLAAGAGAGDLYRRLREANPAPFAGSARLPGFSILSSSPERLLELRDGVASTRPIAGTRPRGSSAPRDAALRAELTLDEKERAEHVMLVDLERNDLGRICSAGTVRVDEFMSIESYAHVHHIVSNVRGELRPGVGPGQAIAAVFPGGTITGCPKLRCMQLLADLEGAPRDAYTGSMGYLGRDGALDLNILIRTLTVAGGRIEFRTGGGIVADSRPDAELAETRAKALGLLRALGAVP